MDLNGGPPSSYVLKQVKGLPILVVDEDATSLRNVASLLQIYTYEVTTTMRPLDALAMFEGDHDWFKIVFANLEMAEMDSLSFLRALTEKDIPLVAMIPEGSTDGFEKAMADGASYCLKQPVCPEDLRNVWQHVLRKKKRYREEAEETGIINRKRTQADVAPNIVEPLRVTGTSNQHWPCTSNSKVSAAAGGPTKSNEGDVARGLDDGSRKLGHRNKSTQQVLPAAGNKSHKGKEPVRDLDHGKSGKSGHTNSSTTQAVVATGGPILNGVTKNKSSNGKEVGRDLDEGKTSGKSGELSFSATIGNHYIEWIAKPFKENGRNVKGSGNIDAPNLDPHSYYYQIKRTTLVKELVNSPTQSDRSEYSISSGSTGSSSSSTKNKSSRFVWTSKLHAKFLAAISELGAKKARPKAILEKMNEPSLTLGIVASHLKKYKAEVKRIFGMAMASSDSKKSGPLVETSPPYRFSNALEKTAVSPNEVRWLGLSNQKGDYTNNIARFNQTSTSQNYSAATSSLNLGNGLVNDSNNNNGFMVDYPWNRVPYQNPTPGPGPVPGWYNTGNLANSLQWPAAGPSGRSSMFGAASFGSSGSGNYTQGAATSYPITYAGGAFQGPDAMGASTSAYANMQMQAQAQAQPFLGHGSWQELGSVRPVSGDSSYFSAFNFGAANLLQAAAPASIGGLISEPSPLWTQEKSLNMAPPMSLPANIYQNQFSSLLGSASVNLPAGGFSSITGTANFPPQSQHPYAMKFADPLAELFEQDPRQQTSANNLLNLFEQQPILARGSVNLPQVIVNQNQVPDSLVAAASSPPCSTDQNELHFELADLESILNEPMEFEDTSPVDLTADWDMEPYLEPSDYLVDDINQMETHLSTIPQNEPLDSNGLPCQVDPNDVARYCDWLTDFSSSM